MPKRKNPFRDVYDSGAFRSALDSKPSGFPYLVDIELTNNCNLRCLFCQAAQAMNRKRGFMQEAVFKKVINECAEHKTPVRFIRWGEPFLHPKILWFCEYVKSKGLLLHITNNGLVISEEQMKAIVDLKVDSITFSMQGATKEEYERMRDNNEYDQLEFNIRKLVAIRGDSEKPFIQITSTMLDDKKEDVRAFRDYWKQVVDEVRVGKTIVFWNPARLAKLLDKQYSRCAEVYTKLSVDWNGKITACCGDYDNLLTIGDINKTSLREAWKSKELAAIRTLLDSKMHRVLTKCASCQKAYEGL